MTGIAITLDGLVTGRGAEPLGEPLTLRLGAGEALVVTGPNGAGKSTLLRTLAGLLPPLAGRIGVENGVAPDGEPARHLHEVAHHLGHRNALKGGETLRENLRFWQAYLGGRADERRLDEALAAFDLRTLGALAAAHLSAGQQRRAALARLIAAPRPVWLLDEPTAALDAASSARFRRLAAAHCAAGGILVAATHVPLGIPARELALAPFAAPPGADPFA